MSPAHFCRRFSQIYGLPPHRYQLVMRMIKAKLMLHSGEKLGAWRYRPDLPITVILGGNSRVASASRQGRLIKGAVNQ
ncbi:hypothetical protein AB4156_07095 [Cupriavidus sp. 2MCAB6]|uniref:hypothetical protein n=1 Tax=Cupriavidus sp. 2MCAB6 TaxID=3232981 RepID=UPI003F92303E